MQTRRLGSFQGLRTARCQARFHFDPQSTAWKVQLFVNGLSNKGAVSTVTSTSNGASDLERIGDLAENVAKRVLLLTEEFEIGEAICRSLVPPGWSRIRL